MRPRRVKLLLRVEHSVARKRSADQRTIEQTVAAHAWIDGGHYRAWLPHAMIFTLFGNWCPPAGAYEISGQLSTPKACRKAKQ